MAINFNSKGFKNPTPQQLAIYSACILAGLLFLSLFVFKLIGIISVPIVALFVIFVMSILVAYIVIYFAIEQYLTRRIKLIYKIIHQSKLAPKVKMNNIGMNNPLLDDVEKEVVEWTDNMQKDIDQLKSMEEYRRNFMGDISHELKTPIFNIQGYIHTLLEGGLYDEKINKSYLNRSITNVERLITIIEDLDVIAKLEAGKIALEMQEFSIQELTIEVFDDLEIMAAEKNIKLQLKEGADNPFAVVADRESIRQVLMNLVTNSIKYGKVNGYTKVGFYDMDKRVLVEVADNGIGIPKQQLKRVFERFFRVDKSRSRQQGGSGLGLSIVKHIMEAHKQGINVRSSEGLGSTFGFTLDKGA